MLDVFLSYINKILRAFPKSKITNIHHQTLYCCFVDWKLLVSGKRALLRNVMFSGPNPDEVDGFLQDVKLRSKSSDTGDFQVLKKTDL